MKKEQIEEEIREIKRDVMEVKNTLKMIQEKIESKSILPDRANRPNPLGYKRCFSHKLIGGFKDPAVRELVIELRKYGMNYTNITQAIKDNYPDNPEKHVGRSAIHRFIEAARKGRLVEYGIEKTL